LLLPPRRGKAARLLDAGQQAAQALTDVLFPPKGIRATPFALLHAAYDSATHRIEILGFNGFTQQTSNRRRRGPQV